MRTQALFIAVAALSSTASAQVNTAVDDASPPALSCPAGARQVGGAKSAIEATGCVRYGRDGARVFHGPYVAYWPNGVKQAEGQYLDGARDGRWAFFDEAGIKTGETDFKAGDYHGTRVEFFPNGQKRLEEVFVRGRRQGPARFFDELGRPAPSTPSKPRSR